MLDSTYVASQAVVRHVVTGPGRVDVVAGRNIDLGNAAGITTRGNLDNPYLRDGGASIVLQAGALADYARFVGKSVAPGDLPLADQAALTAYVRAVAPSTPAGLDLAATWDAFNALPLASRNAFLEARKPVLDQIYFHQLARASGAVGGGALDLARYDAVIASLHAPSAISGGDINLFGSQIKTEQGGAIDIFAPGGSVLAGLANVPSYLRTKPASELGVFTVRGGAINAEVRDDFLVNQGRVFTLGGGDITLASQYGNIDAGRGAKTAVSAPPPLLRTDANGNTVVDIAGSISGSGIATLKTSPSVPASNVYPIAPRGTFDAGDAGVRSSGTVSIVAATVLNAGNITASSGVSGAKTADTGSLGGAVSSFASTPVARTDAFANAAAPNPDAATSLTVELLGYGVGASGAPADANLGAGTGSPAGRANCKPGEPAPCVDPQSGDAQAPKQ